MTPLHPDVLVEFTLTAAPSLPPISLAEALSHLPAAPTIDFDAEDPFAGLEMDAELVRIRRDWVEHEEHKKGAARTSTPDPAWGTEPLPEDYVDPEPWPEPTTAESMAALDRIVAFCAKVGTPMAPNDIAFRRQEIVGDPMNDDTTAPAAPGRPQHEPNGTGGHEYPNHDAEATTKRPSLRNMFDITQDADAELSWQADGLIPHGGIVLFVGGKSAGKSTLARQYALCVARGDPFLGREVEQAPVVVASLEDPKGISSEHWNELGLTADDPVYGWDGDLPDDPTVWLGQVYDAVQPRLILIDSFGRWTRGKASLNSYDEIVAITEPIISFSRRTQCVVAFTHHVRKGGGDDVSETVSGSMALIGLMDSTMHLLRDGDGKRTIQTTQRAGVDMETTALLFDNGKIDLGGVVWRDKAKETEAKVLATIPGNGDSIPNQEVMRLVGGNKQAAVKALHRMVDEGIIESVGLGTRKAPLAYRLRLQL